MQSSPDIPISSGPPDLSRLTVLVVDDEEPTREVLSDILQSFGANVHTAADGPEAIRLLEAHGSAIHLAIIDLSMPRMNGVDVAIRMRELNSQTRIILSSGYAEDDVRGRFPKLGCHGFIQKPFRPSALFTLITKIMST